jgi:cell division inhibitor SulA
MSALTFQFEQAADDIAPTQRIIEFVFPGDARQQLPLILPVLGHLSNSGDQRWLTCIGPQLLAKKDCQQYRLNWQRLLQVLPNQRCAVIDLAERALHAGKSHTVVCVVADTLSEQHLARLERAAAAGNCQGIVIRSR